MRATIEAIAGAVAMKKPVEVKNMEKAEKVSIRRKRARRRGGDEARSECRLTSRADLRRGEVLKFEMYSLALGRVLAHGYRRTEVGGSLWTSGALLRRDMNIL